MKPDVVHTALLLSNGNEFLTGRDWKRIVYGTLCKINKTNLDEVGRAAFALGIAEKFIHDIPECALLSLRDINTNELLSEVYNIDKNSIYLDYFFEDEVYARMRRGEVVYAKWHDAEGSVVVFLKPQPVSPPDVLHEAYLLKDWYNNWYWSEFYPLNKKLETP